jgi:hypothetical protein
MGDYQRKLLEEAKPTRAARAPKGENAKYTRVLVGWNRKRVETLEFCV